jgi:chromosome segregation ATPase
VTRLRIPADSRRAPLASVIADAARRETALGRRVEELVAEVERLGAALRASRRETKETELRRVAEGGVLRKEIADLQGRNQEVRQRLVRAERAQRDAGKSALEIKLGEATAVAERKKLQKELYDLRWRAEKAEQERDKALTDLEACRSVR